METGPWEGAAQFQRCPLQVNSPSTMSVTPSLSLDQMRFHLLLSPDLLQEAQASPTGRPRGGGWRVEGWGGGRRGSSPQEHQETLYPLT